VIADPPVAPAVKVTDTCPPVLFTSVAVPIVGAAGTVVAVTEAEAADARDVPLALVAVTVYVYAVFDCNPVTVTGLDAPVPVNDPGDEVAVYPVIADPPVAPAVNATEAEPLLNARPEPLLVIAPIVGACGTVVAVMLLEAADWIPTTLVDVTPVALKV
jgi:hypothetical protein